MDTREVIAAHVRGAHAFHTETMREGNGGGTRETISESSTNVDIPSLTRPMTERSTTSKSTADRTPEEVDALVRMLSRRTTTHGQSSGQGYEEELEGIMGEIFGHADDDISKRKNVGVIWKNLTVIPPLIRLIVGERYWGGGYYQRDFWRIVSCSV
jgi:ABC-transporter N-terminal